MNQGVSHCSLEFIGWALVMIFYFIEEFQFSSPFACLIGLCDCGSCHQFNYNKHDSAHIVTELNIESATLLNLCPTF